MDKAPHGGGGPHSTLNSILASRPAAPGSILGVPKIFSDKILDVVEIYRQRALLRQWTVQSLIVDWTHPVLVRAVLQKKPVLLQYGPPRDPSLPEQFWWRLWRRVPGQLCLRVRLRTGFRWSRRSASSKTGPDRKWLRPGHAGVRKEVLREDLWWPCWIKRAISPLFFIITKKPSWLGSSCGTVVGHTPHDREVVGLNPAGCWSFFSSFLFSVYLSQSISDVSLIRFLTVVQQYWNSWKNGCLAVQFEAKQASYAQIVQKNLTWVAQGAMVKWLELLLALWEFLSSIPVLSLFGYSMVGRTYGYSIICCRCTQI